MAIETNRLIPNNISDMGTLDEDSGLRLFRGMCSPWDQIKSFKETYNFLIRHAALFAVSYVNAFKIIVPDYELRQNTMSKIWAEEMKYTWDKSDPLGMTKDFEERFSIPPFIKEGEYRAACYADKGDEMMLMPGYIWYASNDRIEKEIHKCQFDIVGPEACDISIGGGQYFCHGLCGKPAKNYETERKGCGDAHCHVVFETKKKYGEHPNADGYDWEMWGPPTSGMRKEGMPYKEECEFLNTGTYTAPLGGTWTAGEMYQDCAAWPMAYSTNVIKALRVLLQEEDWKSANATIETMFDTAGKMQFGEWNTRRAAREWMGVPADVDDGRVLGGYISMIFQARKLKWEFKEFSEERTVIECEKAGLEMMGQHPEFDAAYAAYFNGMAKTLVNAQWQVTLADDAPEGTVQFVIEKGLYGFRRQKNCYTKDWDTEKNMK